MLAYNRNDVLELNQIARALRHQQGELGQDVLFQTERGERAFAERDRVYFLKNDQITGCDEWDTWARLKPSKMAH